MHISRFFSEYTFAHELGHVLGADHANLMFCVKNATGQDVCASQEYGDRYDVMGSNGVNESLGLFHFNAPHKIQAGWLESSQVQEIKADGTYDLSAIESSAPGIKAMKIKKADSNDHYYLEYRDGSGFDSDIKSAVGGSTLIHRWNDKHFDTTTKNPTNLIKVGSSTDLGSEALKDGMTYNDSINGISIKQLSHNQDQATLQITFDTSKGLQVSPSSVKVTVVAGGGEVKAFDITANDRVFYSFFGYPTSYGSGINFGGGTSGVQEKGKTDSFYIFAAKYVEPGVYSGEQIIKDDTFNKEIKIPVEVTVVSSSSPIPSPSVSPEPSPTVSPSPAAPSSRGGGGSSGGRGKRSQPVVKTISQFRVAESPIDFQDNWQDYYQGIVLSHTFTNPSPGTKSILIQFRDSQKQIIKINGLDYIQSSITLEEPTPTPTTAPNVPAANIPNPLPNDGPNCPISNPSNYDIGTLYTMCSLNQLARFDLKYLVDFPNEILIDIGRRKGDLGGFLANFSGERLLGFAPYEGSGFSLDILNELPDWRKQQLPGYIQDQLK